MCAVKTAKTRLFNLRIFSRTTFAQRNDSKQKHLLRLKSMLAKLDNESEIPAASYIENCTKFLQNLISVYTTYYNCKRMLQLTVILFLEYREEYVFMKRSIEWPKREILITQIEQLIMLFSNPQERF